MRNYIRVTKFGLGFIEGMPEEFTCKVRPER